MFSSRAFGHVVVDGVRVAGEAARVDFNSLVAGAKANGRLCADTILVDPWSDHASALTALDRTLCMLGGELVRESPDRYAMVGDYFVVNAGARGAAFLRDALVRQGHVRRVVG